LHVPQRDAVLRALVAGETRLHGGEVELDDLGVLRFLLAEQALCFEVLPDEFDVLGVPPGEFEVVERRLVDGEGADSRALFGRHVGDGRPVGHRETRHAGAEELDEAVDDAHLPQALDGVIGIVLYGSVARGEADRRSDIDLWVLTTNDRAPTQREANAIGRDLEDIKFDGDRYAYDIDVEAVQAIPTYTEDIREIVVSGIPIYSTTKFETVEKLLLEEGDSDE